MTTTRISEQIIDDINEGKESAFSALYDCYYSYLCAYATTYVFDPDEAKEIVNDVFMNVWNHHSALIHPVNAYLIRSVRNYCLNYLRDKRQQEVPLSDVQENLLSIQELQIDADPHPLAYLENKEFEEKIYRAVDSLPAKCRDIFVQYLYHNKTYEEIAITNHISSSTVRVQIKIGLAKLRELLGDLYPLFLLIFNFFEK
ncbi:MAG TPA: RNA polymerase sigma-70 factor [Parabacteroides distasonis]|nr:RNA polymerase sigma-70 factor [Parabacteroides distasonis]